MAAGGGGERLEKKSCHQFLPREEHYGSKIGGRGGETNLNVRGAGRECSG